MIRGMTEDTLKPPEGLTGRFRGGSRVQGSHGEFHPRRIGNFEPLSPSNPSDEYYTLQKEHERATQPSS